MTELASVKLRNAELAEELDAARSLAESEMGERMKSKGLEGNLVGDGLTKGGVLCIAPDGELKYTFYEDAGKGIPKECLSKIVEAVNSFGEVQGVVQPTSGAAAAVPVE